MPHFAEEPIAEIGEDDIAGFIGACPNALSVKTVRNLYVHLNAIFEFAIRNRWCHANPCKLVDKPALDHRGLDRLAEVHQGARLRVVLVAGSGAEPPLAEPARGERDHPQRQLGAVRTVTGRLARRPTSSRDDQRRVLSRRLGRAGERADELSRWVLAHPDQFEAGDLLCWRIASATWLALADSSTRSAK